MVHFVGVRCGLSYNICVVVLAWLGERAGTLFGFCPCYETAGNCSRAVRAARTSHHHHSSSCVIDHDAMQLVAGGTVTTNNSRKQQQVTYTSTTTTKLL
eukprot:scaffold2187_cov127-Skeletonema_menzelii.AAC.12